MNPSRPMKTTPETLHAQFERLQLAFLREHYTEVLQQAAQEQWTPEDILEANRLILENTNWCAALLVTLNKG